SGLGFSPGGRWGDYFGAAVDPSDRSRIWVAGEYQASSLDVITDSQIAELEVTHNRPPDCSGAVADPGVLWPPLHKFVNISVAGVTDPDGDPVSIAITGVSQDEPLTGSGTGNTCPDASGIGTPTASVRAERSGLITGDGRVYH